MPIAANSSLRYLWPALLAVFGVYALAAFHAKSHGTVDQTCYNRLVDSFLSGRLDIPVQLSPEITSKPYDFDAYWTEISRQKIYDYSIYKGKVYPYFSVIPVILLYLPFRLVTGQWFADEAAVFLFGFGALVWLSLLLGDAKERYFPEVSRWMVAASVFVMGLANLALVLVRGSTVYSVPLAAGLFFMTGALFFFSTAFGAGGASLRQILWGSLFLGLAVGSRPNLALVAAALAVLLALKLRREKGFGLREWVLSALPFAGCAAFLGLYNYARFDSFFEPGFRYQIMSYNRLLGVIPYDASRFVANTFFYLFQPPVLGGKFPFVSGAYSLPAGTHWPGGCYATGASVAGMFAGNPFTYLLVLCPLLVIVRAEGLRGAFSRRGFVLEALRGVALYYFGLALAEALLGGFNSSAEASEAVLFLRRLREELPLSYPATLILGGVAVRRIRSAAAAAPAVFPVFEFGLAAACAFMTLTPYLFYMCPALRHSAEFTSYFILMTILVWFYFDSRLAADRDGRNAVRALGIVLATVSSYFGSAYAIHAHF